MYMLHIAYDIKIQQNIPQTWSNEEFYITPISEDHQIYTIHKNTRVGRSVSTRDL